MKKIDDPIFVVDADGVLLTAVGFGSKETVTIQSVDPELVEKAKAAADAGTKTEIIYNATPFVAGWDTAIGVLAALVAAAPGRTYIKQAPDEAMQKIWDLAGPQNGTIIY